ncbi:quaternary amine ABC transporter ATP-binding protein [Wukongibacter sp. M2B1]|uniref:quaternary amine ABC transporter ATP-binding protein n=1 Tax=Wukongibacter sp. M2B1 TaxID=3088895 RepID=UPI003D7AF84B
MKKKVEIENVYKIFGKKGKKAIELLKKGETKKTILNKTKQVVALNNVSLSINEGEVFVVMGLSGSGKSTLVRCINRLITPTEGVICIDGQNIIELNSNQLIQVRRNKISMVFQNFGLFPHLNIIDNVAYGLKIQGIDKKEYISKAKEAIETVGLKGWGDSLPNQLSGGMQQRVGLARALANDPDILLMDEAFSALDPLIRSNMQDELLELQSKMNKTIIFITHDLDEALKIGDRIALMKDGQVVQTGTPEEILTKPANEYVEKFVRDVDITKVLTVSKVMKKPIGIANIGDTPEIILKKMKKHKLDSIFVTNNENKLIGILRRNEIVTAIDNMDSNLYNYIDKNFNNVNKDTNIDELFKPLSDSKEPIAVVSSDNHLLGIIVRKDIIKAIAKGGN